MSRFVLQRKTRGGILVECLIALGILSAAMVLAAQASGVLAAQRRSVERKLAILLELDRILERVAKAEFGELDAVAIEEWSLSESIRAELPSASLAAEVKEDAGEPRSKRVSVSIRWTTATGKEESQPLVMWRHATEGAP